MRIVVGVSMMPGLETGFIRPVGKQPDFFRLVGWTQDFHALEAGRCINQVRPIFKSRPDFGDYAVGESEATLNYKHK